jgi:hypothetical protein
VHEIVNNYKLRMGHVATHTPNEYISKTREDNFLEPKEVIDHITHRGDAKFIHHGAQAPGYKSNYSVVY